MESLNLSWFEGLNPLHLTHISKVQNEINQGQTWVWNFEKDFYFFHRTLLHQNKKKPHKENLSNIYMLEPDEYSIRKVSKFEVKMSLEYFSHQENWKNILATIQRRTFFFDPNLTASIKVRIKSCLKIENSHTTKDPSVLKICSSKEHQW